VGVILKSVMVLDNLSMILGATVPEVDRAKISGFEQVMS
jgi:hypothetical protein